LPLPRRPTRRLIGVFDAIAPELRDANQPRLSHTNEPGPRLVRSLEEPASEQERVLRLGAPFERGSLCTARHLARKPAKVPVLTEHMELPTSAPHKLLEGAGEARGEAAGPGGFHLGALILCLLLTLAVAACSEGARVEVPVEKNPVLSLAQTSTRTLELRIAGPVGLRGLQGRLTWDSAALKVTKVEAGREAARIDRVFFSDPSKADGGLVFGLTDTRQVLLPARGALLTITFEPIDLARGSATVQVTEPVAVIEAGKTTAVTTASAEVKLQ